MKEPILIIGMARSGTTLVSHILGSLPNIHVEVEPHALWKSGNFHYFSDESYDVNEDVVRHIQSKLTDNLNGKRLVEKSPINSLRPGLVHAVFPDAKVVYIERNPVRCIYSNYKRSVTKDAFKLSIILKKYFIKTGSDDLSGAVSRRKLHQQLRISDVIPFFLYVVKMFFLRQRNSLPFGPKLSDFERIVKKDGLIGYHVAVYEKSRACKLTYKSLYGDNLKVFKMEDLMRSGEEIRNLISFVGEDVSDEWVNNIQRTFDKERTELANKEREEDIIIRKYLERVMGTNESTVLSH